jgi:SulP family sulfate permease
MMEHSDQPEERMPKTTSPPRDWFRRLSRTFVPDLGAGATTAVIGIPQGMAYALLAGVNPIYGLYTAIVSTAVAGLSTSSAYMNVSLNNTLALAVGSTLGGLSGDVRIEKLFVLTLIVGIVQLGLGLLRMGGITRFVSNSVMTGFVAGSALLIMLGQIGNLTGYASKESNKILQVVDVLRHFSQISLPPLLIGLATIGLILLLFKTPLKTFAMLLALVVMSLFTVLLHIKGVQLVGDVSSIPASLPGFRLPRLFNASIDLIYSAIAVAILGLVQSSSVSQSVPNPDGKYPDPSRDFVGQGLANVIGSFFHCMPAGGSLSGTALNVNAGARTRLANIFAGILTGIVLLLFGQVVENIVMSSLGALLIIVGYNTIPKGGMKKVWRTGWEPRLLMLLTLAATLALPIQDAIYLGVVLSIGFYIYSSSRHIRVVEMVPTEDGHFEERPAPVRLPTEHVTILTFYGSLYFAAVSILEQKLPAVDRAHHAVVILRLRGREAFGSTFIRMLEHYAHDLQMAGGKLLLAGVDEVLLKQLRETRALDTLGEENVFLCSPTLLDATTQAYEAGVRWIQQQKEQDRSPTGP